MHKLNIPIHHKIYTLRGKQIMLDEDLAMLHEVEYENLKSQFATLGEKEDKALRSQIATLENKRGKYRKYMPYVVFKSKVTINEKVMGFMRDA